MAYVPIPKDLNIVKTKVIFNLTKRQLICFSIGGAVGLPVFFLTKPYIGSSLAALVMMFILVPAMLFAMYEKNGRPLELVARDMINVIFIKPKQRPYKTRNIYSEEQEEDNC